MSSREKYEKEKKSKKTKKAAGAFVSAALALVTLGGAILKGISDSKKS